MSWGFYISPLQPPPLFKSCPLVFSWKICQSVLSKLASFWNILFFQLVFCLQCNKKHKEAIALWITPMHISYSSYSLGDNKIMLAACGCRWTHCGGTLLHIMLHIFFYMPLTLVLMIRPPKHCHLVHYFRAENELQYSFNMVHGDNSIQAHSFCTLAIQECLWRVSSRRLQPDWMSWLYLRWFILLLDMMHQHKTRSSVISITTSRARAGHSCALLYSLCNTNLFLFTEENGDKQSGMGFMWTTGKRGGKLITANWRQPWRTDWKGQTFLTS